MTIVTEFTYNHNENSKPQIPRATNTLRKIQAKECTDVFFTHTDEYRQNVQIFFKNISPLIRVLLVHYKRKFHFRAQKYPEFIFYLVIYIFNIVSQVELSCNRICFSCSIFWLFSCKTLCCSQISSVCSISLSNLSHIKSHFS